MCVSVHVCIYLLCVCSGNVHVSSSAFITKKGSICMHLFCFVFCILSVAGGGGGGGSYN